MKMLEQMMVLRLLELNSICEAIEQNKANTKVNSVMIHTLNIEKVIIQLQNEANELN